MNVLRPHMEHTKWSDRLAFDVALTLEGTGDSMNEVCRRHGISVSDLVRFSADTIFLRRVETYRDDIRDKGITFRLKARTQAEELLVTSWDLIHDPGVSAAVKADLIKSTVKWAGLETKTDDPDGAPAGGVRININFGNAQAPVTLSAESEGETIEYDPEG